METTACVVTDFVVIVKLALVTPAAMVTLVGRVVTAVLLVTSETTAPPAGALPLRVTVPREDVPPATVFGLSVREVRTAGETVIAACCVEPFQEAVMMAES
jgi:hypothetical protein